MSGDPGSITTGLGKLTPEFWDRIRAAVLWAESHGAGSGDDEMRAQVHDWRWPIRHRIMAICYNTTELPAVEITTNIWRYPWKQAKLSGTVFSVDDDGLAYDPDDTDTWALNGAESGNDGHLIESLGVNIEGEDYPAGFDMMPIGGPIGAGKAFVVPLHLFRDVDGVVRYMFSLGNDHDGTCEVNP